MGLGTNHSTVTTAANFIPEMWENETIAAYKRQVVLGNLVTKINFKGKYHRNDIPRFLKRAG